MAKEWSNWSGSLRFTPAAITEPEDEEALAALVRRAAEERRTLRVVGAGHSSAPLVRTEDTLVSLTRMHGLLEHDTARGEAVIAAGTPIQDVGNMAFAVGLAMHNTGDVDVQTLAGAIGTGTHGTGRHLGNLATILLGGRLVTADGSIRDVSIEESPELVRALRVSLGSLGILTRLRVQLRPAYRLHRREWCTHIDDCLARLPELIDGNRNFDFYWYPRSDLAKLRTMNEPGGGTDPGTTALARDVTGWSHEVLARKRELRFDEMEYVLPFDAAPECFREVRARVKDRWRGIVGWRLLYRTIAADDAFLSPMYGRESVTISLHQNVGLPFQPYFEDIEPIFREYDGRPHWGKKHGLGARALAPLYPGWQKHRDIRRRLDPEGVFLSPDLRALLEEE